MKIIHLTDTHLLNRGEMLHGLDPCERFQRCIESVKRYHSDAHCLVMTGDIADRGESGAYELFMNEMASTGLPVHCILGNHDSRENFREQLPNAPTDQNDFVQFAVPTPVGVFLFLDTLIDGSHNGGLCPQRRVWLRDQLELFRDQPVYLFMHHPPFDLNLPCIDVIGLNDKRDFAELVGSYQNVRHLFFGHAHRALCGQWMGISFSSLRGTNHQVKLDFERSDIQYSHEDPEYAVVFIEDDRIVVHTHNYYSD